MKVTLIGSGNVATVLGKKIRSAGHELVQVFSPRQAHAAALARLLNCAYTSVLDDIDPGSDLYIIAVTDTALPTLAGKLSLGHQLVLHTAGPVSISSLQKTSRNFGVLYPLQSLKKDTDPIPELILLVDANTADGLARVQDFAGTIAGRVERADDAMRLRLHVAAVIVNNFPNQLYALTENFCRAENLDFRLLLPLINETAHRLQQASPLDMQTGPAVRNDLGTIAKHLALLDGYPELQQLYDVFSKSILRLHAQM